MTGVHMAQPNGRLANDRAMLICGLQNPTEQPRITTPLNTHPSHHTMTTGSLCPPPLYLMVLISAAHQCWSVNSIASLVWLLFLPLDSLDLVFTLDLVWTEQIASGKKSLPGLVYLIFPTQLTCVNTVRENVPYNKVQDAIKSATVQQPTPSK